MTIDQKTAKIDMFFGYRFGVAFGWFLESFWEAKSLDFRGFLEEKLKAKKHDVLEDPKKPSRRGKKQSPEALAEWEEDRGDKIFSQVACRKGRGGTTKNQHACHPTRPWAEGPANRGSHRANETTERRICWLCQETPGNA